MTRVSGRRRRGGFTLIEVLLVLTILVILASLAVVNIASAQRKANKDAARTVIGTLENAVRMYHIHCNSYPNSLEFLINNPGDPKWGGPYLEKGLPMDPWNQMYQYACPGQNNPGSFDIWTVAEDGETIGNWGP
jgi:general secretion pathway protein G